MTVDGSQERDRGQAETSAHAQAQASHDASVAASELLEAWSEFAPSFPAMVSKSQQLVAAVSQIGQSIGDFEVTSQLPGFGDLRIVSALGAASCPKRSRLRWLW